MARIWKRTYTPEQLNDFGQPGLSQHLGIVFTEVADDHLTATMPVDQRTHQPFGLLHGGASVALAETIGSMAGNLCVDEAHYCVGLDINANHVRAMRSGTVTAVARPFHLGAKTQVWDVRLTDEQERLVCVSRLTLAILAR